MASFRSLMAFSKQLWREIDDHHMFNGAAALAYFFLLAVFPAAIFIISLLSYLSIPHLQHAIMDLLRQVLPEQSASLLKRTVEQVVVEKAGGLLTFGVIFTLWSASAGVYALMQQLNLAYAARDTRPFWKVRGVSIALMLLFVLLMIGSLSLAILGGVVQSWLASIIGWSRPLLLFFATLRWMILAIALLFGLAVIYRFGPDVNVKFRFISPGNVVGAGLIAFASMGFRLYVSKFANYSTTYGSLGAIIILMLWLYLTGIAVLVGCEINVILRLDKSSQSEPDPDAALFRFLDA
jgi:membrane protein